MLLNEARSVKPGKRLLVLVFINACLRISQLFWTRNRYVCFVRFWVALFVVDASCKPCVLPFALLLLCFEVIGDIYYKSMRHTVSAISINSNIVELYLSALSQLEIRLVCKHNLYEIDWLNLLLGNRWQESVVVSCTRTCTSWSKHCICLLLADCVTILWMVNIVVTNYAGISNIILFSFNRFI